MVLQIFCVYQPMRRVPAGSHCVPTLPQPCPKTPKSQVAYVDGVCYNRQRTPI